MKLLNFNSKAIITVFVISIGFASCSKKNSKPAPLAGISNISIIHAVPATEKLSVYIDNDKATAEGFSYGMRQDYQGTSSGNRKIGVAKQDANVNLEEEVVVLESQINYSLFVIDKLDDVKVLLLKDDLTAPEIGKAKVRFVNLSPDSDPLDLEIVGKTDPLATNKAFKEFGAFETIDVGAKTTFNVKNTATGDVLATLANVNIENGKIYTIYAKGLATTNGGLLKGSKDLNQGSEDLSQAAGGLGSATAFDASIFIHK